MQTYAAHPAGAEAVQVQDPFWDYNTPGAILARDQFTTSLPDALPKAALTK